MIALSKGGGFAQFGCFPVEKLLRKPDRLSYPQAAALGTALAALKNAVANGERDQVTSIEADIAKYVEAYRSAKKESDKLQQQIAEMARQAQSIAASATAIRESGLAEEHKIGADTVHHSKEHPSVLILPVTEGA